MSGAITTGEAASRDGTRIAFSRQGSGPPLIVVDGALCSRGFGPSAKLAARLAPLFTVVTYDRRGRGASGDGAAYAPDLEVEDLAALMAAVGRASLLGLSSGGALALRAAASGLDVSRVAAYEPPYIHENAAEGRRHERELQARAGSGDRGATVTYFMRDMVGVPRPVVLLMRLMPWVWRRLKAVAHTLPYDALVMDGFAVPAARFAAIRVPVLVASGSKTQPRIKDAARRVAAAVPGARHLELPGQTHNVGAAALSQAVAPFLRP